MSKDRVLVPLTEDEYRGLLDKVETCIPNKHKIVSLECYDLDKRIHNKQYDHRVVVIVQKPDGSQYKFEISRQLGGSAASRTKARKRG